MRKILNFVLLFIMLFVFVSCDNETSKLNFKIIGESSVEIGKSIILSHDYEGTSVAKWSVNDNSLATINNGELKGISIGDVIVYLEIENKKVEKTVTVIKSSIDIIISGENSLYVGENIILTATPSQEITEPIVWKSSDESIATINQDGVITALQTGEVTIFASALGNTSEFVVNVKEKISYNIVINCKNKGYIGEEFKLEANIEPALDDFKLIYESVVNSVATIDEDGNVVLLKEGIAEFKVYLENDSTIYSIFTIEVISAFEIRYEAEIMQGKYNTFKLYYNGEEVTDEVTWSIDNQKLAIIDKNIMLGVNKGTVNVTCENITNNFEKTFEVKISQFESDEPSEEELTKVEEILNNMTLSQKIGQMFVVGFNGTSLGEVLSDAITSYNFGNVIYMGYNVTSPDTLSAISDSIQNLMVEKNGVAGFIAIDQEGGRVARLTNGGTHFISNMAMAGTGDYNNTYLEGIAMGKELRNYGINLDFAPVLDVNNNPENPIIGIRSYSDNPLKVGLYGVNMFTGLQSENVMGCSKHFPGHGNTSVDSHYGLPQIDTGIDELYQTELAPFISAISNGIDSIMTTHIIFSAIDKTYPATLSKKVLTDLLREELGYQGLIITDGMEMDAVSKNFGGYDQTAVLAVKAGVDVLTYTTTANPITAHKALTQAVKNGEITEERINESVRRILLKKLKYDLLDNYLAKNEDISELLALNDELNIKFAMDSLTLAKGEFNGLDKEQKILIISPETSYNLGSGLSSNSFANYTCNYLKENGYDCDYEVVSNNISKNQSTTLLEKAKNYDQVIVAFSNVKTSGYSRSASFINSLVKTHRDALVIALDTPYDIMSYSNVKNYICVYGYQKATVIALSKYLNGEFKANGKSPININY